MTSKIKKIPYKFVHVFWIDIVSDSAWRSIEDVLESKCPRCLSTGFLVSAEDEDFVRLVSDFNFNEDGTIDECGNSTIIPRHNVYEIKEVT
jgi:phage FluMu protein Com|tara:strand:+ start:497 stop:769 length:273 start_codon:yes stop_codon:yes gene_type:complete